MFLTYLRRELSGRKRQTTIIAIGMGLAISLVILVNALSVGVRSAQSQVLESIYGVGTDITVTGTPTAPSADGGHQEFAFGAGDGATANGTQSISTSHLGLPPFSASLSSDALTTIAATAGVKAAAGVLSLENISFNGQLPDAGLQIQGVAPSAEAPDAQGGVVVTGPTEISGGPDGAGGSAFDIGRFSVMGVDPSAEAVGPLSSVTVSDGRGLSATDVGTHNALVDSAYATSASLSTGSTLDIGGATFTVVGIVTSSSTDSASASNVYIPLDVAQSLSGQTDSVSDIYVQATDATRIDSVQAEIETALPDATVKSQADLASSVSGSLGTAANLIGNLGTWLSYGVLATAFIITALFTISSVTRRTRELGTLKALGWRNSRILGQITGESLAQGLIGGAVGIVIGIAGIITLNVIHPSLTGSASAGFFGGAGQSGPPDLPMGATVQSGSDAVAAMPGFGPGGPGATQSVTDIALQVPLTLDVMLLAAGLAILGGLIAGALGGWRATRLSPAAALRSVN